ncbi:MAG: tetratricopeptide repeat protein [Mycobacterium leprae]
MKRLHRVSVGAAAGLLLLVLLASGCSKSKAPEANAGQSATDSPVQVQQGEPQTVNEWNDRSFTLIKAGKWADAEAAANSALKLDPKSSAGWFNLGRAQYGQLRYPDAVRSFQTASTLTDGKNTDVEYYLGMALERAGRANDAVAVYKKALATFGSDKQIEARLNALVNVKLTALQEAASQYTAKPSKDTQQKLVSALEAYLQSASSSWLGVDGNAMGVMNVMGNSDRPRIVRLHTGETWVQWWENGQPYVQRLPFTATQSLPFASGGRDYMLLIVGDGSPGTPRQAELYGRVPNTHIWKGLEAFGNFPSQVGNQQVAHKATAISLAPGAAGSISLQMLSGVPAVQVCDAGAGGKCVTTKWDGASFQVP